MAYDNQRGGANAAPRKRTVLDDPKISMSAKCPTAQGKWSTWRWGYHKNQFNVVIWTNDPADEKKKIDVNFPLLDFYKYMAMLEKAIDYPDVGDHKDYMDIKDKKWIQAQNSFSADPLLQGTIIVGKKDGVVWQSLVSFDNARPKIRFPFGNTMYNELRKADGAPMTDSEISVLVARATLKFLQDVAAPLSLANYEHKEKAPPPGQQGQQASGGQRALGYTSETSGSGQRQSTPAPAGDVGDDDIPW